MSTWFPEPASTSGIFVRDQADALIEGGNKVAVFMFKYYSLYSWLKKKLTGHPLSQWIAGRHIKPLAYNFVNYSFTRFSSNPLQAQKKAFLNFAEKKFADYINQNGKPDIIHHHGVADFCYITAHLSKCFSIPYVITEHSMFIDKVDHFTVYETKEERLNTIQQAAVRITVGNFYAKFNEGLFHAPFIVVPNMLSSDFITPPLPQFPKNTGTFYFLNIGALSRRKRQDIIIQAFAGAFKNNKNVKLIIAGNGELEAELKKLIASLNMQEQIELAGYKERNEIIKLHDTTHVEVISSEKESFSMAAAEALVRGNPVLSTRCGGPEDFINEQNGLLCNVNDVADMQEKLQTIYNKYSTYNHAQIAKDAAERFSEQKIVSILEEVYSRALKK